METNLQFAMEVIVINAVERMNVKILKKSLIQPKQRNSTCMLSEYHKIQFDHRHSSINANKVRSCQLRLNKAVDSIRCVQSSVNKILWAEFFRFTPQ